MIKKVKKYLNDEEGIYNISKALLAFAFLCFFASVWVDIVMKDNGSFIQRSGAIIVLFGVMVEFALSNINFIVKNHSVTISGKATETTTAPPKIHNLLKNTAHIYIIVGTFIWGYVDCLWKCF